MTIDSKTEHTGHFRQTIQVDGHLIHADVGPALGGEGSAPGPHDLFDASLAACKALTAHWYAQKNGIPLERIGVKIDRDDSRERQGTYVLKVRLTLEGSELTSAQREKLADIVSRCPVHKLMTTATVEIETSVEPSA